MSSLFKTLVSRQSSIEYKTSDFFETPLSSNISALTLPDEKTSSNNDSSSIKIFGLKQVEWKFDLMNDTISLIKFLQSMMFERLSNVKRQSIMSNKTKTFHGDD